MPAIPEQSLSDISPFSSLKGTVKSSKLSGSKKNKASQLEDLAQQLLAEAAMLHTEVEEEVTDFESSEASSQQPSNSTSQKTRSSKWADYQDS